MADFLSRLVLFRHDPELVEEVKNAAEAGDVDAWYALGLIYAEGRGIEPDPVAAYVWLSRGVSHGDQEAADLRYIVLQQMSPAQIAEAERQSLGARWQ